MEDNDKTTENRIKDAARKIFHEKGYGTARTREIAEAAGINTALLNYYFRSKENLFNIIMTESLQDMFANIFNVINDENTDLSQKIEAIVDRYMAIFQNNPNLPLFVLGEIQANPEKLLQKTGLPRNLLPDSFFFKQMHNQLKKESIDIQPLQIFINIISLTILPIVANPLLKFMHTMTDDDYSRFIEERRVLILRWVKDMLKLTN